MIIAGRKSSSSPYKCMKLWRLMLLIIGMGSAVQATAGECNLVDATGTWWKGTSDDFGVYVNIERQEWMGNTAGQGKYRVTLNISMDQGAKYYDNSLNNFNWAPNSLPPGVLPDYQSNCMEGHIVEGRTQDVSVGGGTLKTYLSPEGGGSGTQEMRIVNETDPGAVRIIETIRSYQGSYMIGVTSNGNFQITKTIDVLIDALNIQPGNYTVSIPILLAGTSTWFMSGANNWWTTNPAGTPEYKQTIYLPLDIRIDDTGEPGNPDVICSLSSTDITLSHGNVLYNNAHRNIKQESFAITCDGETTVDITLQGMDNTHDPYTVVNMGPGPGLSSYLSVSLNQTDWARTLTGAALVNGATTFYLQSELQAGSDLLPGSYTGSAVAIVNIL
ncbi:hypothetical protein LVQ78_00695 [Buttiauxella sp. A2-C2_NF]|uniref:MrpH family fimbial adhesin n=1 Tax=Buttiauxella TaxID=82976 RepID=UPI00139067EE|nr:MULTISPECIES: PapG chaperone-binding domain-containing protein [Buttiauxella]MCE0824565.1 hypothetical protein [Buttiauxella ferragutiae]UNK63560.1 hypothetical protein MNO13_11980 [Buttiauxella ferragutiae]